MLDAAGGGLLFRFSPRENYLLKKTLKFLLKGFFMIK